MDDVFGILFGDYMVTDSDPGSRSVVDREGDREGEEEMILYGIEIVFDKLYADFTKKELHEAVERTKELNINDIFPPEDNKVYVNRFGTVIMNVYTFNKYNNAYYSSHSK